MIDSTPTNHFSKDNIPAVIQIEMTYQLYNFQKQNALQQVPSVARPFVNQYFEWLENLKPLDVVDAIEQNRSIEDAKKKAPIALRMSIAVAKGFLKANRSLQTKLRQIATPQLTLETLKFENPVTYEVIQQYGERGTKYLDEWVEGALKMLGC